MKLKGQAKSLLLISLSLSVALFLSLTPRCELGTSAVYQMTHWISFTSVPNPVTVKMLINAETRPYLTLLNTTFTPAPSQISKVQIHFNPGDTGQQALLITWTINSPATVVAKFETTTYETHYVTPILSLEDSNREEVRSTQFYPLGDPIVQRAANEVLGRVRWQSNTEKARAVYDWLMENIHYDKRMVGVYSPVEVLHHRRAVCEGLAYTFATLCKALGVPARVYYGNVIGSTKTALWEKHCWAEFWDGFNWQPVDPTLGHFGTLSIYPHTHTSFGLWAIEVRSERGTVWPVNMDGRVVVSGCGLDWSKLIGYGKTSWVYMWLIADYWMVELSFILLTGVYLKRKELHRYVG